MAAALRPLGLMFKVKQDSPRASSLGSSHSSVRLSGPFTSSIHLSLGVVGNVVSPSQGSQDLATFPVALTTPMVVGVGSV